MQEFCPVCTKNDIKSKVRSYQVNFNEAVFMCENEQCAWPAGFQELTFINRPLGKDWSNTWDESASNYWKSLPDPIIEFSAYTPPQTPGSEIISKDTTTCAKLCPLKISKKTSELIPVQEDNPCILLDFSNYSYPNDSSIDNNVSNGNELQPKSVTSYNNACILGKSPEKGNVFTNDNYKDTVLCKVNLKSSLDSNVNVSHSTSINSKSPVLKHEQTKVETNLKTLNKKKPKICPFEFDFEELKKRKSTNVEENNKLDLSENKKVLYSDKKTNSSNMSRLLVDKRIIIKKEELITKKIKKSFISSRLANKQKIKALDFDELFKEKNKNIDKKDKLQLIKPNKVEEKLKIVNYIGERTLVDIQNSRELDSILVDRCELIESKKIGSSVQQNNNCELIETSMIRNDLPKLGKCDSHKSSEKNMIVNNGDLYESEKNEKNSTDDDYIDLGIDLDLDSILSPNSEVNQPISGILKSSKDSGMGQYDEGTYNGNDSNSSHSNNGNNQNVNDNNINYNEYMVDFLNSFEDHVKPTTDEFFDALFPDDI